MKKWILTNNNYGKMGLDNGRAFCRSQLFENADFSLKKGFLRVIFVFSRTGSTSIYICIGRIAEIYDRENGSVHTKESMLCIAIFMRKMTVCQNVSFTKNAYFTR